MRGVVLAFLGLGLVPSAQAADLDMLRGSSGYEAPRPSFQRWSGFYVGGQAGGALGSADFTGESSRVAAYALRSTMLESEFQVSTWGTTGRADSGNSLTYGGFAGYNFQWDEIVFGVEANYMRTNISAVSTGGLSRIVTASDGYQYTVTSTATAQINVTDVGQLRGRIGYAFDRFLGYATIGGVLGYADYGTTARISYPTPVYAGATVPTPPNPGPFAITGTDGKSSAPIHGFSVGVGMDMALTQNLFLRGEYEYMQFTQYKLGLSNVRGAIGLKF